MRLLTNATLFLLLTTSAFAHKDRIVHPQSITVNFKNTDRVTFSTSNSVIAEVALHIGSTDYTIPSTECAKLRDIRFDSVRFSWNGSYKSATDADYMYLTFDMGTDAEKSFGELPRVTLMFRAGKFENISITKKTAQDTWQQSKL